MKSGVGNFAVGLSFFLGVVVCVLAVRGRGGVDRASWTYFRYLADGSVRSNVVEVGSDWRRVWVDVGWGHVGAFDGQLVWGYHINADQSGVRPRFDFGHEPYDGMMRWFVEESKSRGSGFPVSWEWASRTKEAEGDDSFSLSISIAHWLLAVILFVAPVWKGRRVWKAFRKPRQGE